MTNKEITRIPLDTGWETPPEENPIVAQIEGVGRVFRKNPASGSGLSYDITDENGLSVTMTYETVIYSERVVRVMQFFDEKTGLTGFRSLDNVPDGFHPSDLPKKPLSDLSETDVATIERDLVNVLKKGASKPFFDIDEQIRSRGGDPTYRVPKSKQGGWRFSKK